MGEGGESHLERVFVRRDDEFQWFAHILRVLFPADAVQGGQIAAEVWGAKGVHMWVSSRLRSVGHGKEGCVETRRGEARRGEATC